MHYSPCPARARGVTSGFQLKDTRALSLYVGLMASGVYLRQGDKLVAMAEQPYATEDVLQELLEHYPELLADDTGGGEPRRWLLVDREVGLASDDSGASRWSVDHLFVDQDGVPTLVETKRSSDTRIRREVVGQMLDYAANAVVYWRLDRLQSAFQAACEKRGADSAAVLAEFLAPDDDPDAFWARVRTNLAASRLRLVFVADAIPRELRRIVEFLNEQMGTTEVLAVEIKQYVDSGGNHQTLVPRLLGQTEAARQVKRPSEVRRWDRSSVLYELDSERGNAEGDVARRILEWADRTQGLDVWFGYGQKDGSFQVGLRDAAGKFFPFALYTYGRIEVQFQFILTRPPFDDHERRAELQRKLNAIPGVNISDEALRKRPSIPLAALTDGAALQDFLSAMDWAFEQARLKGVRGTP
jgi:hypothetical protein